MRPMGHGPAEIEHKWTWYAAAHIGLLAVGIGITAISTMAGLPVAVGSTALAACVLYVVSYIRRRSHGVPVAGLFLKGALVTLVCLPLWLGLFWLAAQILSANMVLLVGVLWGPILSVFSSGLMAFLEIGKFRVARQDRG